MKRFFLIFFAFMLYYAASFAQPSTYAAPPYSTGFESGSLDANWYTAASGPDGRIQVWQSGVLTFGFQTAFSHTGNYFLGMDNFPGGFYVLTEAWMGLDLSGGGEIDLSFWWAEWNDETEPLDGVYFSDDGGTTFTKVLDLNGASYPDLTWYFFQLDVDQLASSNGLSLTSNFVVKFQQYDNYYFAGGNDGFLFDDIEVTSSATPLTCPDVISVNTDPGQCGAIIDYTVNYNPPPSLPVTETFEYSGTIETWTVPPGVTSITVEAYGAQGGGPNVGPNRGGLGAYLKGDFAVSPGDELKILVGQQGQRNYGYGGGGGSFVTTMTNTPLLIAGGGGGAEHNGSIAGYNAVLTPNGMNVENALGGVAGGGGQLGDPNISGCGWPGGGGGGLLGNGGPDGDGGGFAFVNGGGGGTDPTGNCVVAGIGGFGGGGSGGNAGGGGGGYSGGAGGANIGIVPNRGGGGGGSFNGGTNQANMAGARTGNGQILITYVVVPQPMQVAGLPSGSQFPVGTTTNTYEVTDQFGTQNCSFTVTVTDNEMPTAVCQNTTVQLDANGDGSIVAADIDGGSNDACGVASLAASTTDFGCADIGDNTITLTVTDVNDNTNTCTATVTVEDNVAPSAVCQNFTVQLDGSGNAAISASNIDGGSTDACGIASLSASPNTFDCNDVGINSSTLTVTDNNGNSNTCSASVTVEDNAAPTAVCQDFTLNLDNEGTTTLDPADIDGGSSTVCGTYSLSVSPNGFDCDDLDGGPYTVTLTVTDDSNSQTDNCTASITVADPDSYCCAAPAAVCQNFTLQLDANGNGSITASDVDGGSTADCGLQSLTVTPTSFTCADIGANTVTLTITDINNESDNCMATVTVEDNVDPEIMLCQGNSIDFNGEEEILSSSVIDFDADDACGVATITYDPEYINCEQIGQTVAVTVTVTDLNGNESDCTANIVVSGLPCGWMDFGDNGIGCVESNEVSYDESTETFTLTSEGCYSANWSADNAAYTKYEICGDGEIVAHVASISSIGAGWAGISARESEAPGSKKVALATNLGNYLRREIRTTTNGYAIPQQFFRPAATWLKITRTGNLFIGSASSDGVNWQTVLMASVPMTPCIQFGLYVTNNNAGTLTATFDNVEVTENSASAFSIPDADQQGTEDQSFANRDFSLFPNPATDEIQLDLSSYAGQEVQVEILNQLGQSMLQRKIAEVGYSTERFNLSGWSDGTYLVRVVKDQEQLIKKFVIVK